MSSRAILTILCIGALTASACAPAVASGPAAAAQVVPAPMAAPPPVEGASPDFDGDGKADLAAGIYIDNQYALRIWYGSGAIADIMAKDVGGPATIDPEAGAGGPLLAADFDGDGYCDLAFQSPTESRAGAEAVVQVFGSPTGLDVSRRHTIALPHSASTGVQVRALAFVPAPTPRVAVGVELWTETSSSARVQVFDLDDAGVAEADPLVLRLGAGGIPKLTDDKNGSFGNALATAGNRLFVGVPGAKVSGKTWAGAVVDITLGATGVTKARSVTQSTKGVTGAAGKNDMFGYSLVAGDGYLVAGTPRDAVGKIARTGSVQIFTVKSSGLSPVKRLSQAGSAVPGKAESGDWFGRSVALGRSCSKVTSVVVGGMGEGIAKGHSNDGAVWLIPLTKAKGCAARQVYEGHGLSGKPHFAYLGEFVAALRDATSSTDTFAFAGGGSWSEGPIGELFRWSPTSGQSFRMDTWPTGLAGRR